MNKKFLWTIFSLTFLFSVYYSFYNFEKAMPFINLSVTMDKNQAEQEAIKIAKEKSWGLDDYDLAVKFHDNQILQSFVELEAGGKEAFISGIKDDQIVPYYWSVRFFKEKEVEEVAVFFSPEGRRFGFKKKLSENKVGNNISKSKAQSIAEKSTESWNVDLKPYKLVDYSHHTAPGGREDHSFVYERKDIKLGAGLYQLKLTVAADEISELVRCVKIPDEFNRRYAEMRSANELLAGVAESSMIFIYILLIGSFSFFFLFKKRYLLFKQGSKVFLFSFVLILFSKLNSYPLIWNNYITTSSKFVFLISVLGRFFLGSILLGLIISVGCLLGEAINRYSFGNHIQFFKLWTSKVAGTFTILECTLIGYMIVPMMIMYEILFSTFSTDYLGWWSPLSTKVDPDVLSTFIPFLSPIAGAFVAGFMEEFFFRVIPIAGVILLFNRSKNRKYWVIGVFILQALIFGAAHANYPMQPAYYRVVELFLVSFNFGLIFYFLGVLPGIICHFTYDTILMLIPIFSSTLFLQKVLGVGFLGIPLFVVLFRWLQQGTLHKVLSSALNSAWKPSEKEIIFKEVKIKEGQSISKRTKIGSYVFAAAGMIAFIFSGSFKFDSERVTISKYDALQISRKALNDTYGDIGSGWNEYVQINEAKNQEGSKFIFETYGRESYAGFQGSYIIPEIFSVRYLKFDMAVENRAEEYGVWIGLDGKVINSWHLLPEACAGEDVSEAKAEKMAFDIVDKKFGLKKSDLEIVSSLSIKHAARRDWTIIFKDVQNYNFNKGQARITVAISGDKVTGVARYIYPPEEWSRADNERSVKQNIFKSICGFGSTLFLLFFIFFFLFKIGFSLSFILSLLSVSAFYIVVLIISTINSFESILFGFNTVEPFAKQVSSFAMASAVKFVFSGLSLSLMFLLALFSMKRGRSKDLTGVILPSISVAIGLFGLLRIAERFIAFKVPKMPLYGLLNYESSFVSMIISIFVISFAQFSLLTAFFKVSETLSAKFKNDWIGTLILMLGGICWVGSAMIPIHPICIVIFGGCIGLIFDICFRYIFSKSSDAFLISTLTLSALSYVPSVLYGTYEMIFFDFVLAFVVLLGLLIFMIKRMHRS